MVTTQIYSYAISQIQYNYQKLLLIIFKKYFTQIWLQRKHKYKNLFFSEKVYKTKKYTRPFKGGSKSSCN